MPVAVVAASILGVVVVVALWWLSFSVVAHGVAVHLLGHVAFRRRNTGTWNPHRTATAVLLLLAVPLAWQLPALAALALVAALLTALVGYEVVRFGQARSEVRHHAPPSA